MSFGDAYGVRMMVGEEFRNTKETATTVGADFRLSSLLSLLDQNGAKILWASMELLRVFLNHDRAELGRNILLVREGLYFVPG